MKQTPLNLDHNTEILHLMPTGLSRVVEVGCGSGALANGYRQVNPDCRYTGIEIDPQYAEIAQASCGEVLTGNIELFDEQAFSTLFPSDCWVFGDVLEHLYDPWAMLRRVRLRLAPNGCVIACVPNAQHWSLQANLAAGLFRYREKGLMDRTHIRWFTRTTLIEMFDNAGYKIVEAIPRYLEGAPQQDRFINAIGALAAAIGTDPAIAMRDASVYQWVVKAICSEAAPAAEL